MHFQASITKVIVYIASEGSMMVKSEKNTLKFKQSVQNWKISDFFQTECTSNYFFGDTLQTFY